MDFIDSTICTICTVARISCNCTSCCSKSRSRISSKYTPMSCRLCYCKLICACKPSKCSYSISRSWKIGLCSIACWSSISTISSIRTCRAAYTNPLIGRSISIVKIKSAVSRIKPKIASSGVRRCTCACRYRSTFLRIPYSCSAIICKSWPAAV